MSIKFMNIKAMQNHSEVKDTLISKDVKSVKKAKNKQIELEIDKKVIKANKYTNMTFKEFSKLDITKFELIIDNEHSRNEFNMEYKIIEISFLQLLDLKEMQHLKNIVNGEDIENRDLKTELIKYLNSQKYKICIKTLATTKNTITLYRNKDDFYDIKMVSNKDIALTKDDIIELNYNQNMQDEDMINKFTFVDNTQCFINPKNNTIDKFSVYTADDKLVIKFSNSSIKIFTPILEYCIDILKKHNPEKNTIETVYDITSKSNETVLEESK